MIIAFLLIFIVTSTALADWVDYATWTSHICLYGFTTSGSVVKDSGDTWYCIVAWVGFLRFASTPQYDYLLITPKTSSGLVMGQQTQYLEHDALGITITNYRYYNSIKLRIDNPNTGNNMESGGQWDGYIE